MSVTPVSRPTNCNRWVGRVPAEAGTARCRASDPARPRTKIMGSSRPSSITTPSAVLYQAVFTAWYNTALGVVMLLGRLLPMIFVLGLAGSLARQRAVPASAGTLPTHRLQFVGLLTGVTLIVVALTY